jgi:hypothetical protein
MSQKTIFGGAIAVILLGLYVYTVIMALLITSCLSQKTECKSYTKDSFTSGMAMTMATVGGLVSALVIAELAITKPGETPQARSLGKNPSNQAKEILKFTTMAYLMVWTLFGLLAFIIGFLQYPNVLQPLTDIGQAWLGLAVAAAYSYLGIKPEK